MEVELLTNRLSNIMRKIKKNHMEVLVNKEKMQDERFVKKEEPQRTMSHNETEMTDDTNNLKNRDFKKFVSLTKGIGKRKSIGKNKTEEDKIANVFGKHTGRLNEFENNIEKHADSTESA